MDGEMHARDAPMNWEARSIYANEFKKESEGLIREIVFGALDKSPNQ